MVLTEIEISKILNIDDDIPNFPSFQSYLDLADKKNILGIYKLKESTSPKAPEIIELRVNGNILSAFSEKFARDFWVFSRYLPSKGDRLFRVSFIDFVIILSIFCPTIVFL